jgi:hypothetical protein
MDGLSLLSHARSVDNDLAVILITGHGDIAMAVRIGSGQCVGHGIHVLLPCRPVRIDLDIAAFDPSAFVQPGAQRTARRGVQAQTRRCFACAPAVARAPQAATPPPRRRAV